MRVSSQLSGNLLNALISHPPAFRINAPGVVSLYAVHCDLYRRHPRPVRQRPDRCRSVRRGL